jgi:transaldolase/glucose-6-phosphate isomerase
MSSDQAGAQPFRLGGFEDAVKRRLRAWGREHVGRRIWDKDFTVWSPTSLPEITNRLGWLTLPRTMAAETAAFDAFADEVKSDGVMTVVLLGMGGSSLAPDVLMACFGSAAGRPALTVLDSTHPAQVAAVESGIDLKRTLFVVASKSGTTIEPLSLFKYFYKRVSEVAPTPGRHFAAITDSGTPLEELARRRGFRRTFLAESDVGGRYSALTAFGLLPASLIGVETSRLLEAARSMADACGPAVPEEQNPGLMLGAALGELALAGKDKVTFAASRSLEAFPDWLEQLIAESTGKDEKGIVPVVGEPVGAPGTYVPDRVFVYIGLADEGEPEAEERLRRLEADGHPVSRFILKQTADLAGEMFRWEMAVAAASAVLGVHPFNQPDVQAAKQLARRAMADGKKERRGSDTTAPVDSSWDRRQAMTWFRNKVKPGDYMCIQAYLKPDAETIGRLADLRSYLRESLRVATTVGFGPRFLHSTGQLHKGGPNTGVFLQLMDTPDADIAVPETDYSFCELLAAQALGDYYALLERDRRVIRVNLGADAAHGLDMLVAAVEGTE